jgi:hypothetical protein
MYFYVCDAQNQVTQLFWIYRTIFDLLRLNPEILIMDAIFKTNRFRLPLFNIVGTTLLNTTFFVAFVFTNSRAAGAFTWIFEKLREVYRARIGSPLYVGYRPRRRPCYPYSRGVPGGLAFTVCMTH